MKFLKFNQDLRKSLSKSLGKSIIKSAIEGAIINKATANPILHLAEPSRELVPGNTKNHVTVYSREPATGRITKNTLVKRKSMGELFFGGREAFNIVVLGLLISLAACTGKQGNQGRPGVKGGNGVKGATGSPGDSGEDATTPAAVTYNITGTETQGGEDRLAKAFPLYERLKKISLPNPAYHPEFAGDLELNSSSDLRNDTLHTWASIALVYDVRPSKLPANLIPLFKRLFDGLPIAGRERNFNIFDAIKESPFDVRVAPSKPGLIEVVKLRKIPFEKCTHKQIHKQKHKQENGQNLPTQNSLAEESKSIHNEMNQGSPMSSDGKLGGKICMDAYALAASIEVISNEKNILVPNYSHELTHQFGFDQSEAYYIHSYLVGKVFSLQEVSQFIQGTQGSQINLAVGDQVEATFDSVEAIFETPFSQPSDAPHLSIVVKLRTWQVQSYVYAMGTADDGTWVDDMESETTEGKASIDRITWGLPLRESAPPSENAALNGRILNLGRGYSTRPTDEDFLKALSAFHGARLIFRNKGVEVLSFKIPKNWFSEKVDLSGEVLQLLITRDPIPERPGIYNMKRVSLDAEE